MKENVTVDPPKRVDTPRSMLALLKKFPKKKTIQLGVDVKGLEGNPQGFVTVYEPSIEDWRDEAIPKLEAFLKDHAVPKDLEKKAFVIHELDAFEVEKVLVSDDKLVKLDDVKAQRAQLKKLIEEDVKVSVLEMFCYQGPPTKHWIETKGQFWEGWNKACDKVLERLEMLGK